MTLKSVIGRYRVNMPEGVLEHALWELLYYAGNTPPQL